jgi:hypothetical protein
MTLIKFDETAVAQASTHQSRREALKRFGCYATAAPTVMVLLQPREGHAGKGNGHGWGKGGRWGRGGNSHY